MEYVLILWITFPNQAYSQSDGALTTAVFLDRGSCLEALKRVRNASAGRGGSTITGVCVSRQQGPRREK